MRRLRAKRAENEDAPRPRNGGSASITAQRADRARRKASAPFFFGRQAALFALACIGIIVLDFFLYVGIAVYDSNLNFGNGSPKSITRDIGDTLVLQEDGSYALPEATTEWMEYERCWAMLLSDEGEPVWNHGAPESVLHPYTMADVAVFSRMGYLDDYPCFVWKHDDGLLVAGFPKDSYVRNVIDYLPQQTMLNWPLYVLFIFLVDAAALFIVYSISKRRVMASTAPMIEALDALAHEKPARVRLKGSLRDVGESINAASAIMRRKDEARKRWVTGVSHDIRTPLAISLGHAERIARNEDATDDIREQARVIMRQNERIRDLVADLNIASKLEYDMQPADLSPACPARLVRAVAADCANAYADGPFSFEADIDEAAEKLELSLDARLIDRALRNLTSNAIRHNDAGCTIRLIAHVDDGCLRIGAADDGAGVSRHAVARLNKESEEAARAKSDDAAFSIAGPVPPPHFAEYRPDEAVRIARRLDADDAATPVEGAREGRGGEEGAEREDFSLAPKDLIGINEHGLGLSLVARIAAAHGGRVEFDGAEGEGFSAIMVLSIDDTSRSEVR